MGIPILVRQHFYIETIPWFTWDLFSNIIYVIGLVQDCNISSALTMEIL